MLHYAAPMHGLSIRFERETKRLKRGTHEGKKKKKKKNNLQLIEKKLQITISKLKILNP